MKTQPQPQSKEPTSTAEEPKTVELADFGKDHFSLMAYLETRCVDFKGTIDKEHMRCNPRRHPGLVGYRCANLPPPFTHDRYKYPSVLKAGVSVVEEHDDWDCLYDLEREGFIEDEGTGAQPLVVMTPAGLELCAKIRAHKAGGGSFGSFAP